MSFHRNDIGIKRDGLIWAFDDQSKRCIDDLNTKFYNLLDPGDEWTVYNGSRDGEGYFYYDGTVTAISNRSYLDQSDLTKNLLTTGNTEEYAMEAWVRIPSDVLGDTTLGWQIFGTDSALGVGLQLMRSGSLNLVNFGYRTNSNFYSVNGLALNTWYHICGSRRDPGEPIAKIYINGVQEAQKIGATVMDIDPDTAAMHSGRTGNRITSYFIGNIPIMRLYNVGLTTEEVVQNFNAQKHRFGY